MAVSNISTNNAVFTLTIGTIPIIVDNFSPESDMWSVADVDCGQMDITPDGKSVKFAKNFLVRATLTLNGASTTAELIRTAINAQTRNGNIDSTLLPISVIIVNDGHTESFLDGTIESGPSAKSYGNQKLLDQSWNFAFSKRIYI